MAKKIKKNYHLKLCRPQYIKHYGSYLPRLIEVFLKIFYRAFNFKHLDCIINDPALTSWVVLSNKSTLILLFFCINFFRQGVKFIITQPNTAKSSFFVRNSSKAKHLFVDIKLLTGKQRLILNPRFQIRSLFFFSDRITSVLVVRSYLRSRDFKQRFAAPKDVGKIAVKWKGEMHQHSAYINRILVSSFESQIQIVNRSVGVTGAHHQDGVASLCVYPGKISSCLHLCDSNSVFGSLHLF